jgi:hypothetical protein
MELIMTETYLYIKQHSITGMKYFGKTTRDPYKYNGSGKHWLRHIKKHGKEHVKTIWCKLFTDIDELERTAIAMSEMYDVVDSEYWANLINENGLDGNPSGINFSEETRVKLSIAMKGEKNHMYGKTGILSPNYGKNHSEESRAKISIAMNGKNHSEESRAKMSNRAKSRTITTCPHCNKSGSTNMKRYHFDNCKFK